jgi:hypothetical protein
MVVDSSDEEIEDDFDVTLRTPSRHVGASSEAGTPESPARRFSPVPGGPQSGLAAERMFIDPSSLQAFTTMIATPGDKISPYIDRFTAPSPAVPSPARQHSIAVQNTLSTASDAGEAYRAHEEKVTSEVAPGSALDSDFPPAPVPPPKPSLDSRKRRLPEGFDLTDPPRLTKRRTEPCVATAEPTSEPSYATVRRSGRADGTRARLSCDDGSATRRKPSQQTIAAPRTAKPRTTTLSRSGTECSTRPSTTRMAVAPPQRMRTRMSSTLAQPSTAPAATDRTRLRAPVNGSRENASPPSRGSEKRFGSGERDRMGGALRQRQIREPMMKGSAR